MDKIDTVNLVPFRNHEHFQFMTDFVVFVEKATPDELNIPDLFTKFNTALTKERTALGVDRGSIKSKAVKTANSARGKTWNAINQRIKANLISPFEEEVKAAEALKRVINHYGDKRRASMNEKTASLTHLVADLQLEHNIIHLKKLGMEAWVDALKTQNEQFQELFNERNEENAEKPNGNVSIFKKEVNNVYKEIISSINSTITLNLAKPGVEIFVKELNEKIGYYKQTLAIRKGRKRSEKAPAEEGN